MRESEENGERLYSVSEAVQKSGVPSHVLRYWEDELGLSIRRTAQGHRMYSEEDLVTFRRVKDLKEKGIQLKAIRLLFQDTEDGMQLSELFGQERRGQSADRKEEPEIWTSDSRAGAAGSQESGRYAENMEPDRDVEYEVIPKTETDTYRLFEAMLRSLIREAVAGQNEKLEAEIADLIRNEMEELYIQLRQDAGEREAAAAQTPGMSGYGQEGLLHRIKRMFGKGR